MMTLQLQKNNCLVVYFDIYGFSEIIRSIDKQINIFHDLEWVKSFPDALLDIWNWIGSNIKQGKNLMTYLFSDCGFFLYKIEPNEIDVLKQCIGDLQLLLDKYLENGFFLRGGISYGPVVYSDNLLIGQAVTEAVKTESEHCPGPFIIFPSKEIMKLCEIDVLIRNISLSILTLKNQKGAMECHIIFPTDKENYINKINEYAKYFLRHGPFEYGKFWNDTYENLLKEFQKEFRI